MAVSRSVRLTITIVAVAALVIGAVAVGRALWTSAKSHFTSSVCTVGAYDFDPAQASVAATMIGATTKYRIPLPRRAQVLVLAAAIQESKLTNIPPGEGDRDSVGVLQQRPSQGWGGGKTAPLTDVGEATKEFLDALIRIDGWEKMPAAQAIQEVQISADGSLYAQHEPQATALADALSGRTPAGITCEFDPPAVVATASTVAKQAARELGIDTPRATDAKTVSVPGARWQTAAWFVANAERLGIDRVDFGGKRWTRKDGWKSAGTSKAEVIATIATI
ncbi:MAG: hypothetical protein ABI345_12545 [Jatrophihabitans sp.]